MLDAGFVWLKDIGNNALYADVELRRAIEGGWIPGPNIIATGRIIAPFEAGEEFGRLLVILGHFSVSTTGRVAA
jgi:hypothetical protein